jgi:hypothetical protein
MVLYAREPLPICPLCRPFFYFLPHSNQGYSELILQITDQQIGKCEARIKIDAATEMRVQVSSEAQTATERVKVSAH